jgi:hypothetical protein
MKLPDAVYSLKFWEAFSWLLAGLVGILAFFGVIPDAYVYSAAAIFSGLKGILKFFQIEPELRAKGLR